MNKQINKKRNRPTRTMETASRIQTNTTHHCITNRSCKNKQIRNQRNNNFKFKKSSTSTKNNNTSFSRTILDHKRHHHHHKNQHHHKLKESKGSSFDGNLFDKLHDSNECVVKVNGSIGDNDDLRDSSDVKGKGKRKNEDATVITEKCEGKCAGVEDNRRRNGSLKRKLEEECLVGSFTREVYKAISLRLGDIQNIPKDHVKTLFNDMQLFPSDNEVTTMLQCVRQCRNGSNTTYLTFGEFCFLVREMQNKPKLHKKFMQQQKVNNNKCPKNKCEVFLGGSCNPTTWRADTAIPELEKHGISFYNPQVSMWAPELLAQEHDAKQSASVLLFVIDSQTRSTVGMLEVAYLVASGRCVIVVAQPYKKGQTIMGETITDREYCDLVKGQKSLLDLIKSKGVQIHNNLTTALQCTADILRNVSVSGSSPEEQIVHKIRRLREVYDSYNGQMQLYDIIDAYSKLTNRSLEISKLYNYLNLQNSTENGVNSRPNGETNGTLSFEKFCALMAELSTDGCSMCNIEAWATQSFSRNNHQHGQCPNEKRSRCAVDQSQASVQSSANRERFYDVYLGGSLSTGNKWRENIAEPLLKKHGVEYYNPAIRDHENGESKNDTSHRDNTEEDTEWRHKIDRSKIVLFVIPNDTRSLTTMIVAAHYIGSGKDVVLSIEQLNCEGCMVADEPLTKNAIKDYNRARAYLRDVAERRHVPVFDSPDAAVNCVLSKLSITTTTTDLSTTENDRY